MPMTRNFKDFKHLESLPLGACIGILGGGQLGRMLALAAYDMGYDCIIWDESANAPALQITRHALAAPFDDGEAFAKFVSKAEVATVEFENIPCGLLERIAQHMPTAPSVQALAITQNRILEKRFFDSNDIACANWWAVRNDTELSQAAEQASYPVVLKTCRWGYDGKGQVQVSNATELRQAWESLGKVECIAEQHIGFDKEVSVIGGRGCDGTIAIYAAAENTHKDHILSTSIMPANISESLEFMAREILRKALQSLDIVGLLAVEFFVVRERLLANEMAARPHNSGHWTMDGAYTSQFEQAIRACVGLPLGDTGWHSRIRMQNLLGDEVKTRDRYDGNAKIHIYGKDEIRPQRKMGHINFVEERRHE